MSVDIDVDETETIPLPDRGLLLPNQIETDPRFQVRLYDPNDEEELQRIEWLAASIERDGQIDDVVLVPVEDGRLVLLSGHRRRRAFTLINERRTATNKPPLKIRYQVNREGGDLFRKAVIANLQRRDFSPMDLLALVQRIRHQNKWEGFKGAKRVAEYLGLSVATVTQVERFSSPDMDDDLKQRLHHGIISAQSAFDLLAVKPEKRAEVLEKAAEIQADKNVDQAIKTVETRKATPEAAAEAMHSKKRIENPAIKQAIRETPDATDAPQPMSRKEIVEWILQFDAPAYGGRDGAIRLWVIAMEKMMTGTGGRDAEKIARKAFDKMTKLADPGTSGEDEDGPKRTHKGKLPRHDKGQPRKVKAAAASGKKAAAKKSKPTGKPATKKATPAKPTPITDARPKTKAASGK